MASQTSARTETLRRRQTECLELRMTGATIRQIAEAIGVSPATAHRDVRAALKRLAKQDAEVTKGYRHLNLARLDRLLLGLWGAATSGNNLAATREARAIIRAQNDLLGLNAPIKVAQTDPTGEHERTPAQWIMPMPAERNAHEWAQETQAMLKERQAEVADTVDELIQRASESAKDATGSR